MDLAFVECVVCTNKCTSKRRPSFEHSSSAGRQARGCPALRRLALPRTDGGARQAHGRATDTHAPTHNHPETPVCSFPTLSVPREVPIALAHIVVAPAVTDAGLALLAERCAGLAELDLSCTSIGDKGVLAVCERLRGTLRRLSLAGCVKVTSASIVAASQCPGLAELCLAGACSTCLRTKRAGTSSLWTRLYARRLWRGRSIFSRATENGPAFFGMFCVCTQAQRSAGPLSAPTQMLKLHCHAQAPRVHLCAGAST